MARPQKKGLDYFPLDTDFFRDKDIRILRSRYGNDGVMLYLYLLCEIYGKEEYYLVADEDFISIAADDVNMSCEKITQIISFLLKRSLFDDTLFKSDNVLTAKSVQKRYQEICKNRRRDSEVSARLWLLEKEETISCIKVRQNSDFSCKNSDKSRNNDEIYRNNDTKESKVKERESKVKGREKGALPLTPEQEKLLCEEYGKANVAAYKDKLARWKAKRNVKSCNEFELLARWLNEDKPTVKREKKAESSFDTEELDRIAFERYKEGDKCE